MKKNYSSYECPICGGSILETDTIDHWEDCDDYTYTELVAGECEECGAELQWENVYRHSFLGIKNIKKS